MKKKEDKVEEIQPETNVGESNCGSEPTRPGGTGAGDWQCRNGSWVWVENIGG